MEKNSIIGINDNTPQCLTYCLGLQLLDPGLMRRKSNVRMTARASCKTDKKAQLSLLPPISYSPTTKPVSRRRRKKEEGRRKKEEGRRRKEEGGRRKEGGGRRRSHTKNTWKQLNFPFRDHPLFAFSALPFS